MTMTNEQRLRKAKFLTHPELGQLTSDLFMEFDPTMNYADNRPYMPHFGHVLWYLRNYTYAPFSLIGELTGVTGKAERLTYMTHECVANFEGSCMERPVSLDGGSRDAMLLMRAVGSYYGLDGNTPLDRCDNEVEDALLYLQSNACGATDRGKSNGGGNISYKPTPKNQPLFASLLNIQERINAGLSIFDIHEDYTIESIPNHQL